MKPAKHLADSDFNGIDEAAEITEDYDPTLYIPESHIVKLTDGEDAQETPAHFLGLISHYLD